MRMVLELLTSLEKSIRQEGKSEALQPRHKVHLHFQMVLETHLGTPAVAARGIDVEASAHVVAIKLNVVVHTIGWRNGIVVVAQGNVGPWRGARHVHISAVFPLLSLADAISEQVGTRSLMAVAIHHGYNRIEKYLEVGARLALAVRSHV